MQYVYVGRCSSLTEAAAAALETCPSLQSVDFGGCSNLTDAAVARALPSSPSTLVIAVS